MNLEYESFTFLNKLALNVDDIQNDITSSPDVHCMLITLRSGTGCRITS